MLCRDYHNVACELRRESEDVYGAQELAGRFRSSGLVAERWYGGVIVLSGKRGVGAVVCLRGVVFGVCREDVAGR